MAWLLLRTVSIPVGPYRRPATPNNNDHDDGDDDLLMCGALRSGVLLLCLAEGIALAQPSSRAAVSPEPRAIRQLWTLDATYTDAQHGATFRYPSAWATTTHFGMHEPALATTDKLKPVAGFGYQVTGDSPASVPYGQTKTEGFGIVYAAVAAADATVCDAISASLAESPRHGTVVIHGRTYTTRETSSIGMSQFMSGTLYTTYAGGTCYLFETSHAGMSSGVNDSERAETPEESRLLASGLEHIMATVRIHPPPE